MSDTVIVALISAGSSMLVAITALILNYRGFSAIDARFAALEASVNGRFASMDARFASLEASINTRFAAMDARFAALENRMTNFEARVDRRLEAIEADLKEFYRMFGELDKRLSRLEDKQ